MSSPTRKPGIHIAWTTVTYRSVALMIIAGLAVVLLGIRLTFPQFAENTIKAAGNAADKVLQRAEGMARRRAMAHPRHSRRILRRSMALCG